MANYRHRLPQLADATYLTDGGIETTLIFKRGIELPYFAAFTLLASTDGRHILYDYYEDYLRLAVGQAAGFIYESPTWRANADWGGKLGYDTSQLERLNSAAIDLGQELRQAYERTDFPVVLSGCIGPRGDGYTIGTRMDSATAARYHLPQIRAFAASGADLVTAVTMNYSDEALGICLAARRTGIPVVISFTVETDGRLPSSERLEEAIALIDHETDAYPAYYMINCAHPQHFLPTLADGGTWTERIRGIRANASTKSHAELDEATELDEGDKAVLARGYLQVRDLLPNLSVIGGCCGTDHGHLESICGLWFNETLSEKTH